MAQRSLKSEQAWTVGFSPTPKKDDRAGDKYIVPMGDASVPNRNLKVLNGSGDHGRAIPGAAGYGNDINWDRRDDLDHAAEAFVSRLKRECPDESPYGLDIGCGLGWQSAKFASLGADVCAVDIGNSAQFISHALSSYTSNLPPKFVGTVRFKRADVRNLSFDQIVERPLHFVYSQRTLHYLKYTHSLDLFRRLKPFLAPNCHIFLGVSGLKTELGEGYPHRKRNIESRFAKLDNQLPKVEKHNIKRAVCLYEPSDLIQLMETAGFFAESVTVSSFGNIKGIFTL